MHPINRLLGLTCLLTLVLTQSLFAQADPIAWERLERIPDRPLSANPRVHPAKFKALKLHVPAMRQRLSGTPLEVPGQRVDGGAEISLPMPDGTFARFQYVESPIMEPELAAKFPEIKTYMGQGIDDPTATIRFDLTSKGFHAQILSPQGAAYIDPYYGDDSEVHVSYYKRDYPRRADGFACLVPDPEENAEQNFAGTAFRSGAVLRTYRLACAATGEYTQFHGGTVSSGMAAIVTAVNRVNQVYEAELSVRLVLVANNDLIVYTNGSSDPYTNNDGFKMLSENQTTLNSVIGSANYDIGHVFSTGGGGVAYLRSVCGSSKAGGVTGLPAPTGDPFYIDYVSHEIGHQFGGNHTFNSSIGACGGGNRNAATAYEPGSGSTIQAYAGICSSDNLQSFSDPYFHSISFDEMISFISGTGGACAVQSPTGNTVPSVSAGTNYVIPKGTPFTLTATGSDGDADALTYCWEQRDIGASQALTSPDNGTSPLFRSFNPTTSPSRTFPKLSSILANTPSLGEKLPVLNRTMKFRVTARDNRVGGGGVNTSDMQVTVAAATGPFLVTSPNSSVTWSNMQTVTWDVAGTAGVPVNCGFVNILLSTNGGTTFSVVLATNTPNDGSELITLPSIATSAARIKVEGAGNIFFDISDANFAIVPVAPGPRIVVHSTTVLSESFAPGNGAIDPDETVQISLSLKNTGDRPANNMTVTLLADAAVVSPSGMQVYGTLSTNGSPVAGNFNFTAKGACGSDLLARFEIRTNGVVHQTMTNAIRLGGTTATPDTRANSELIKLPANGTKGNASPYPSSIVISNLNGTIDKVTVTLLGLTHTVPDDIDLLLVGPQGQTVLLMSDAGGGTGITSAVVTFDDAGLPLPDSTVLNSGTYQPGNFGAAADIFPSPAPEGPYGSALAVFANSDPNGTWSLYAVDDANQDKGEITAGWRLDFILQTPACHNQYTSPLITFVQSGNDLALEWGVEVGKIYRIQMKNDLNEPNWTDVEDITPDGPTGSFSPAIDGQQKFFRIIALD
ncbi:MAG: hypothetical protein H0X66_20135 [Verrucomicrobia bacterium]|nr:hypothetical protein [Verrucomicrobiota bacterium]